MRITLIDVITAARAHDCPIIHISRLAGAEPFIASSPCLGNVSVPLLHITIDDYLGLMAQLRAALAVELDETLSFPIFTGGGRDSRAMTERLQLPPRTTSGSLCVGGVHAAVYYLMDSVGQETTIVYDGLRTFADIQDYWRRRSQLWRAFVEGYQHVEEDLHDLADRLDRTVMLDAFDVDAFAAARGLTGAAPSAHR